MVNDREVALQIECLEQPFGGKRTILAETDHNPATAHLLDMEIWMREWQGDDCRVNHAVKNFTRQLSCIAMRGPYSASRRRLFVKRTEAAKYLWIELWRRSEANKSNLASLNGNECIDDFFTQFQEEALPLLLWQYPSPLDKFARSSFSRRDEGMHVPETVWPGLRDKRAGIVK